MKLPHKNIVVAISLFATTIIPSQKATAQLVIAEVIKKAIVKVVQALDLQIQRLQNKTIVLQNAQKTLENTMSKLKLDEISDWTEKQRKLYADYFDELSKVKKILSSYNRIKEATQMQVTIVEECKRTFELFRQDTNFTRDELSYMFNVYSGMIDESLRNLDQLFLVINSLATQMTDANRLEIINKAADGILNTYNDLELFNAGNIKISLQRAKDKREILVLKRLYGIP